MAGQNGITVDEMLPGDVGIDIPRDKRFKRGPWKPILVAGAIVGFIISGVAYYFSRDDYVTPDRYPTDGVETTEGVPEGFGSKPVVSGKIERTYPARESRIFEPEVSRDPDFIPLDQSSVYPDGVDKGLFGYDYDLTKQEDFVRAVVEGYINKYDKELWKELMREEDYDKWIEGHSGVNNEGIRVLRYEMLGARFYPDSKEDGVTLISAAIKRGGKEYEEKIFILWEMHENGSLRFIGWDESLR